jgi:D-alanyl-D-alanine carboxypeptidase
METVMGTPRRLLVVVVLLALACGAATADAAGPARAGKLQRALDELVAAGVPGAVVLVRDGDRTIRLTSGYGNLKPRTRMHAGDRFRVGSITKTFVAAVVLQLVGEGKLALDDTVERRLPGLVPNGKRITVRHLLNMTSGLFDYLDDGDPTVLAPYRNGNVNYVWQPRQLLATAAKHKPHFAPGTGWRYCNTCYVTLGLIVETATGRAIGTELRERIFEPLRLRDTTFAIAPRIAGRHAHGYELIGKPPLADVTVLSHSFAWAAGAIVSTGDDLARFYRALLAGRLLRPDLLRAAETTVPAEFGRYGLGLIALASPCGAVWGHGGDTAGYYAMAFNSKDGERQVVVLANLGADSQSNRAAQAFERVLATAYCG